jgi:predicted RNA binding protein YcfA (HicA-like mRNA interferase family)
VDIGGSHHVYKRGEKILTVVKPHPEIWWGQTVYEGIPKKIGVSVSVSLSKPMRERFEG